MNRRSLYFTLFKKEMRHLAGPGYGLLAAYAACGAVYIGIALHEGYLPTLTAYGYQTAPVRLALLPSMLFLSTGGLMIAGAGLVLYSILTEILTKTVRQLHSLPVRRGAVMGCKLCAAGAWLALIVALLAFFRLTVAVDLYDTLMIAGRSLRITIPETSVLITAVRLLLLGFLAVSLAGLGAAEALAIRRVPTLVWVVTVGFGMLLWAYLAAAWSPMPATVVCVVLFTGAAVVIHDRFGEV